MSSDPIADLVVRTGRSREEVVEVFDERAAIREYLGGYSRQEAERRAIVDVVAVLGEVSR